MDVSLTLSIKKRLYKTKQLRKKIVLRIISRNLVSALFFYAYYSWLYSITVLSIKACVISKFKVPVAVIPFKKIIF